MFILPIYFVLFIGGIYAQSKTKAEYPNVNDAYSSWKKNHLELRNDNGLPNQHQAIAVSARRIDEKTATVQVMIISEFDNDGKGFDIKVSAQPMRVQKNELGKLVLEKSGYNSEIEASGLKPQMKNGQEDVVALPSITVPVGGKEDAVSITITIFDGDQKVSQIISIPLKYEGSASAIGRFASSYSQLLPGEWCGSCEACGRVCTVCPNNQSGHFNCVNCTTTCQ
ncbi:MAG: hypothetical protein ACR2J3_07885 [Aridibacter sp.]